MAGDADERLIALRTALAELATEDLPDVLAQARELARERARDRLAALLTDALLDAAAGTAPADVPEPPPAAAPQAAAQYVFGVVAAGADPPAPLPAGIDGRTPVRLLTESGLSAVVCTVAAGDFDEEPLRAHLSDLAWVERMARRHEDVLETIAASATVVPMRMCSVYSSEAGVRGLLEREADALTAALAHLDGKAEWGVKAFCDATTVPDPELPTGGGREASGADYLQRRLRERDARSRGRARGRGRGERGPRTAVDDRRQCRARPAPALRAERPRPGDGAQRRVPGRRRGRSPLPRRGASARRGVRAAGPELRADGSVATLQLRPRRDRSRLVSAGSSTLYASSRVQVGAARRLTLLDLLDRLLAGGVVIRGEIMLAAADVDLVQLDLALLLSSVDTVLER